MNRILSLISKHSGYFHDGSIREIKHDNNIIVISIESAEILSEWDWDRVNIPLSKRETITGKLHLNSVNSIRIDGTLFHEALQMIYDHGDLYDFIIENHKVELLVTWKQFFPKRDQTDMLNVQIEAEKIYWENIPTLFDAYWDSL